MNKLSLTEHCLELHYRRNHQEESENTSSWKRCSENFSKIHSEPCQISKMELFAKTGNGWKLLTIYRKSSILDVSFGCEYASDN